MDIPDPYPAVPAWTEAPMPDRAEWATAEDFDDDARQLFRYDGVCIAVVHGRTPQQALATLAQESVTGQMPAEQAREWAQTQEYPDYGTSLEAESLGDWTLIVEVGGYQASEQAAALSAGTAVAVAYWSGALILFTWAVDGQHVRRFDALVGFDAELPWEGRRLPQEEGLPFGLDNTRAACLALLQRLTGIRITAEDVTDPSGRIALGIHPG